MLSRRNLLILAVLVSLAAAGGAYDWQQRQAAERAAREAIRRETVARGTILSTVSASGSLVPETQVNLYFSAAAPAPVTEVNAVLGQGVRRGEALARLDTSDLALAVTQAEQSLRAAQLTLDQLQAPSRAEDVAHAEANLRLAQAQVYAASQGKSEEEIQIAYLNLILARNALDQTYRTMDELEKQGRFAQKLDLQPQADQQVEAAQIADLQYQQAQNPPASGPAASARAAVEQAQAALDRLKQGPTPEDVQIARLRVSQAQAALDLARHHLAEAEIVAPFDGVVAAVNLHRGEIAPAALPAVALVDVSRFRLEISVDEVDVARVSPGQGVTVTLDAFPNDVFSGQVEKVAPTATVNQGVVSYLVTIVLDAAQVLLRGGMTATAEIVVAEARDVVLVPNWAIRRDRQTGQTFVGLLKDGEIEDVPVELGLRNDALSEVKSGVQEGEVVAVDTRREQFQFFGGG